MKTKLSTKELVLAALFTALTAIGAFIQVPVPFMDYFTLQFLFVVMAGLLLGPRLGAVSVGTYVALGLVGFPVFAAGGGIQYIFRPSFGYLLGFVVAAFTAGAVVQKCAEPSFRHYLSAAFCAMAVTYLIGFAYKYMILNFYTNEPTSILTIALASLPLDIPGDAVLCVAAAALAGRLRHALKLAEVQAA